MEEEIKRQQNQLKNFVFPSKEEENTIEHMDIGYKELFDWHKQSIKNLLEKEVERVKELPDKGENTDFWGGYRTAKIDMINNLQQVIKLLEK